eukprot:g4086.t1
MSSTTNAIRKCQISNWSLTFSKLMYPQKLIPISKEFTQFLVSDRVVVHRTTQIFGAQDSNSDESTNGIDPWELFPEIMQSIEGEFVYQKYHGVIYRADCINELGGCVFPKLNWSAPTDIVWLSPDKSIKCTNSEEVLLFLRSSDRIAHDICSPFDDPSVSVSDLEFALCLKKYNELHHQSEFRCFVSNDQLIGISQRDITQYYPQLQGEEENTKRKCCAWFDKHIKSVFDLHQYSFDVYLALNGEVMLIDFNAICSFSSPLLFSWDELGLNHDNIKSTSPLSLRETEVRFVENDGSMMMGASHALSMPYDMIGCSLADAIQAMKQNNSPSN